MLVLLGKSPQKEVPEDHSGEGEADEQQSLEGKTKEDVGLVDRQGKEADPGKRLDKVKREG